MVIFFPRKLQYNINILLFHHPKALTILYLRYGVIFYISYLLTLLLLKILIENRAKPKKIKYYFNFILSYVLLYGLTATF